MSGPKHQTTWEDEQMAGVLCSLRPPKADWFTIHAGEDEPCPHCGTLLRLRWNVRIEEVRDDG